MTLGPARYINDESEFNAVCKSPLLYYFEINQSIGVAGRWRGSGVRPGELRSKPMSDEGRSTRPTESKSKQQE